MAWEAFKAVKDDGLKRQYLEDLVEKFNPSCGMLGEMFGRSRETVRTELCRLGVPVRGRGGHISKESDKRWEEFIGVDNSVEDVENIPGVPSSGSLDRVVFGEPTAEEMEELLRVLEAEPCVIPNYEGERYESIGADDSDDLNAAVSDPVNHPSHYTQGGIECIEAIKALTSQFNNGYVGYLAGTVLKYLWRHPFKGNPTQDIDKAVRYLTWLADYMKEDNNND